jgi:hypothetical protein
MSNDLLSVAVAAAFGMTLPAPAVAQGAPPTPVERAAPAVAGTVGVATLKGTWVRPDGGYQIVIGDVGQDGRLEAMYFNPNPLPFARAQAVKDGATLRASFELRAGGYGGSTYELTYEPSRDRLEGVYYQAVAKQRFDVYFVRNGAK